MTRAPIPWTGGKSRLRNHLYKLMPAHRIYVEPFGGGASVLLGKQPSEIEVYNDVDQGLCNFFKVLGDPALFGHLMLQCSLQPYSRQCYDEYVAALPTDDPVKWAAAWFYVARASFNGQFNEGWGYGKDFNFVVKNYLSGIDNLPAVHARLMGVHVENDDAINVINRWDTPGTLHYCDPPYVPSTRGKGGSQTIYDNEMTDDDHVRLLDALMAAQGMAMVSGYDCDLYRRLDDAGWVRYQFDLCCMAVGRSVALGTKGTGTLSDQRRTEVVWVKPGGVAQQSALFNLAAIGIAD